MGRDCDRRVQLGHGDRVGVLAVRVLHKRDRRGIVRRDGFLRRADEQLVVARSAQRDDRRVRAVLRRQHAGDHLEHARAGFDINVIVAVLDRRFGGLLRRLLHLFHRLGDGQMILVLHIPASVGLAGHEVDRLAHVCRRKLEGEIVAARGVGDARDIRGLVLIVLGAEIDSVVGRAGGADGRDHPAALRLCGRARHGEHLEIAADGDIVVAVLDRSVLAGLGRGGLVEGDADGIGHFLGRGHGGGHADDGVVRVQIHGNLKDGLSVHDRRVEAAAGGLDVAPAGAAERDGRGGMAAGHRHLRAGDGRLAGAAGEGEVLGQIFAVRQRGGVVHGLGGSVQTGFAGERRHLGIFGFIIGGIFLG